MVAAPWFLVSPFGVLFYVADEATLRALAVDSDLVKSSNGENLLRKLVDPANKFSVDQLPQHVKQWQLLCRVKWLQRKDSGALVPVIGDAANFVSRFASLREDMKHLSIRTSRMPALSPMLDRLLRAQTLCLLCGSSGAILVGCSRWTGSWPLGRSKRQPEAAYLL